MKKGRCAALESLGSHSAQLRSRRGCNVLSPALVPAADPDVASVPLEVLPDMPFVELLDELFPFVDVPFLDPLFIEDPELEELLPWAFTLVLSEAPDMPLALPAAVPVALPPVWASAAPPATPAAIRVTMLSLRMGFISFSPGLK